MPISLALIGDIFPLYERQSAIGTFMGISFLGQGLSMAIGVHTFLAGVECLLHMPFWR
jgi:MFS family permease